MSSAVTESTSWDATVVAPDDGDTANAASVRTPLTSLANRAKQLRTKIAGSGGGAALIPPLTCEASAEWIFEKPGDSASTDYAWIHNSGVASGSIVFPIPHQLGAKFTSLKMRFKGATSGSLPSPMPILELAKLDLAAGTSASVGTVSDPSATNGAYTVVHDVTLTVAQQTMDANSSYFVRIQGGSGGGGAAGSELYGIVVTYDAVTT